MSAEELEYLKDLGERIVDDVRASTDQKREARRLLKAMDGAKPGTVARAEKELTALWELVEGYPSTTPTHDALRWSILTSPLSETQLRWERRAMWQFVLGAAMIPILLGTVVYLAIRMPRETFTLILLSEFVVLAFAYSYVVLRVHQQASVAAERMAEKRAGLTFLRIVLEEYGTHRHFESLLVQGTQMFLGHHAPSTVVLGPEDMAAMTQILLKKAKPAAGKGTTSE
ncbi:MAG TPA: hypothetical protein VF432_14540 [Thermoanaerobaculia bacterium]